MIPILWASVSSFVKQGIVSDMSEDLLALKLRALPWVWGPRDPLCSVEWFCTAALSRACERSGDTTMQKTQSQSQGAHIPAVGADM